jgi:hypothetical protein
MLVSNIISHLPLLVYMIPDAPKTEKQSGKDF